VADISIFPEVNIDTLEFGQGLNVTIVVSNGDARKTHRLLEMLGMPFRRQG
jgi:large subunit ribosomal protein L5